MYWKKLKYEKPNIKIITLENENGFLKGSIIDTKIIDFNIESKPYEVEENTWHTNTPTFE